jgi:hypothetical protein
MSAAIPPLPQYAFMAWCLVEKSTGTTLPLPLNVKVVTLLNYTPRYQDESYA